jgi:hypothetical protein
VSRRVHLADIAVSSSGAVLLNVTYFFGDLDARTLVDVALEQSGEIFIGVVMADGERKKFLRGVESVLSNATSPLIGRRLRRKR